MAGKVLKCEIMYSSFSCLPAVIAHAAEQAGHLRIALTQDEADRIAQLDQQLVTILSEYGQAAEIAADLARGTLAHIALNHLSAEQLIADHDHQRTVKQFLAWLDEHLHHGVGVHDAAQAWRLVLPT